MGALILLLCLFDTFACGYLISQHKAMKRVIASQSEVIANVAHEQGMLVHEAVARSATEEEAEG